MTSKRLPPPPRNNTAIGLRVALIRKHRRLTQRDLASAAGVSRHIIMRIENGHTNLSTADLLLRIAEALHCFVEDLHVPLDAPIPHVHFGRPKFCAARRAPAIVLSDEEAD
jgi:transcriptional regulator with XRE-family HTH domain